MDVTVINSITIICIRIVLINFGSIPYDTNKYIIQTAEDRIIAYYTLLTGI